jgi:hypothetical protein
MITKVQLGAYKEIKVSIYCFFNGFLYINTRAIDQGISDNTN